MESAPLTRAHDHAREASMATRTADTIVAVNEHTLAAGEFATAANDTSSVEALRTLRLLEQHHDRLARLLRYSLEHPSAQQQRQQQTQQASPETESPSEKDAAASQGQGQGGHRVGAVPLGISAGGTAGSAGTTTSVSGVMTRGEFTSSGSISGARGDASVGEDGAASLVRPARSTASAGAERSSSGAAATQQSGTTAMASLLPSQHPQRRHPPSRELSSSIANNLASARGIRSRQHRGQPAEPTVSNDQAPGSVDGPGRKYGGSRAHIQNVLQQHPHAHSSGKPSWVPPRLPPQGADGSGGDAAANPNRGGSGGGDEVEHLGDKAEDGFSRFYSRFGSLINRLSAPLAFAGLPLITEESNVLETAAATVPTEVAPKTGQRHGRTPPTPLAMSTAAAQRGGTAEPDLSRIYSKAALRAIGRDGSNSGNDSFYVVPKTGHTASYANILSFDQKEQRRRLAASAMLEQDRADYLHETAVGGGDEDDNDDGFIDAREHAWERDGAATADDGSSVGARPRSTSRYGIMHHLTGDGGGGGGGGGGNSKTKHVVEELMMENQSLKDMLDKLSRRLHAFEASAQQSHMALQESMRFMQPGGSGPSSMVSQPPHVVSPATTTTADAAETSTVTVAEVQSMDAPARKTKDLEEELARVLQRLEASERERVHQEKTLHKYREKWEKLKAGAKARREAQGGSSSGGGGESSK